MVKSYNTTGSNIVLLTNVYACLGTVWKICDNSLKCAGVSNDHRDKKNNALVGFLQLDLYSFAPTLPRSIEHFFPNLQSLKVMFGSLQKISSDDLRYPKLKVLHLGRNKIRTLDKDLFVHTPKLIFVGFENNQIATVGYKLFDSLKDLRVLYMWGNDCVTEGAFSTLAYMKELINKECKPSEITKREEPVKDPPVDESKENSVPNYKDCQKYFPIKLDGPRRAMNKMTEKYFVFD